MERSHVPDFGFFGIVVAAFEGEFLVKRFGREQRDLIASIAEEQPKNMAILEAEQKKLNRQQIRNAILIEQIVASLPSASGPANGLLLPMAVGCSELTLLAGDGN